MNSLALSLEQFAASRRGAQDRIVERLRGVIGAGINTRRWTDTMRAVERIYRQEWEAETDQPLNERALKKFLKNLRKTLEENTKPSSQAAPTALSVALAILNSVSIAAADADPEVLVLEWVTMHDEDVRAAHADAEGQTRPPGEPFDVGGHKMDFPGDPSAPIALWINCRCVLRPALANPQIASSGEPVTYDDVQTQGVTMTDTIPEVDADEAKAPAEDVTGVPWHGVLAPEGVMSGDGRQFAEGALRNRDLPLPLTWQKTSAEGHDQNVTVAKIEKMERIGNEMHASGHFLSIPESDEVIGLIGEFGRFGVSVDADDSQFEFNEETSEVTFTDARICSACIVAIPAFAEAYVALGPHPELDKPADDDPETAEEVDPGMEVEESAVEMREVDKEERDKRADDGTAMPDGSYPIANCEDLSNAIQAIGRAKDPEATKRHIKKRYNALSCPDVELPEDWSLDAAAGVEAMRARVNEWADIEKFVDVSPGKTEDGPGWLTHPVDTDRLRDYWVRGPGAAKIGWGTPGDFNRCRLNVAEYVKPQYLNGYCANRHYDALGFWPGPSAHAGETLELTEKGEAINIVASAIPEAPAEWFANPDLDEPTGVVIEENGRVYGHIAQWGVCHIGIGGDCVTAPPSESNYDYFATGEVITDAGPVRVGSLTVGIGHADGRADHKVAAAHYDNTDAVWADVAVGEDAHGIWFAGWVRPGTPEEMIYAARAAGRLSGDWRRIKSTGEYELVGALSINVGGFPKVSIAAGAQVSLIAAGMVEPKDEKPSSKEITQIAQAVVAEMRASEQRAKKMAELKNKFTEEK